MLDRDLKKKIIEEFRIDENDTGSVEVQVALLTERIKQVTSHLAGAKHDHSSRRGLLMMVGKRNRLMRYLHRTAPDRYFELKKRLGI